MQRTVSDLAAAKDHDLYSRDVFLHPTVQKLAALARTLESIASRTDNMPEDAGAEPDARAQ